MLVLRGRDGVAKAAQMLLQGQCLALPTETVYGLAADARNDQAVARIFSAKGRPTNHPLIVHIPSAEHLDDWATDVPTAARTLAAHFWPGPLTLLLKKSEHTSLVVTGGLDTVALRVPSHPLFLEVLATVATGLAAPSANRYKALSPTTAEQVVSGLDGHISAVLDGGPCEFGLESTIVDLTADVPRIVRAGPITQAMLEEVLGRAVDAPTEHDAVVPGNVRAHYQPRTPLRKLALSELAREDLAPGAAGFIVYSSQVAARLTAMGVAESALCRLPENAAAYGKQFYAALHQMDQLGAKTLFVEEPPRGDDWSAVNDRLKRALG